MMLYRVAANVLSEVKERRGSVKSLTFGSKYKNKKQLFALVCQTLKYRTVLEQVADHTRIQKLERSLKDRNLLLVILYDYLIGKGVTGAPALKAAVLKHKAALNAELARQKVQAGVCTTEELIKDQNKQNVLLPRYVRVNLVRSSTDEIIQHFRKDGYTVLPVPSTYSLYIKQVSDLQPKQFVRDFHLDDVLTFCPGTDLHEHPLYTAGHIILQDKASCVPAYLLNPPVGGSVIDSCAAPGNKTSHLVSIMKGKGTVFAFDLDPKRSSTMSTQLLRAGILCAHTMNMDFLKVYPSDPKYENVTHILVDPSCSGTGIVNRLDHLVDEPESEKRIKTLANFQAKILKHALSFKNVKRVTYSTCSIHAAENEQVVMDVLEQVQDTFGLMNINEKFTNRGLSDYLVGQCCLRFSPKSDLTNGFFLAVFVKLTEANTDTLSYKELYAEQSGPTQHKPHTEVRLLAEDTKGEDLLGVSNAVSWGKQLKSSTFGCKSHKKKKYSKSVETIKKCERAKVDETHDEEVCHMVRVHDFHDVTKDMKEETKTVTEKDKKTTRMFLCKGEDHSKPYNENESGADKNGVCTENKAHVGNTSKRSQYLGEEECAPIEKKKVLTQSVLVGLKARKKKRKQRKKSSIPVTLM